MRAAFACRMLVTAGLASGALGSPAPHAPAPRTTPRHAPAAHTPAAQMPAPTASLIAPRLPGAPSAGAHVKPNFGPRVSTPPAPLAARPRPGKNVPTTLGGPAKYDAKKGATLGGAVLPH